MLRQSKGAGILLCSVFVLTSCQTSRRTPYADNPLLLSREPLLQKSNQIVTLPPGSSIKQNNKVVSDPTSKSTTSTSRVNSAVRVLEEKQVSANNVKSTSIKPTAVSEKPTKVPTKGPELKEEAAGKPAPAADTTFGPATAASLLPNPPAPPPQPTSGIVQVSCKRLDHAADHSWLQGEFDLHYRGYKELRFRSLTEEDPFGGKVRLLDDPRLNEFKPGDLIRVEGELMKEDLKATGNQYPRFQIRSVQLIERKTAAR